MGCFAKYHDELGAVVWGLIYFGLKVPKSLLIDEVRRLHLYGYLGRNSVLEMYVVGL